MFVIRQKGVSIWKIESLRFVVKKRQVTGKKLIATQFLNFTGPTLFV